MADRVLSDHNHRDNSDGSQSATWVAITTLLNGADFLFVTDHMEAIEQATVGQDFFGRFTTKVLQLNNKQVGFEASVNGINDANHYLTTGDGGPGFVWALDPVGQLRMNQILAPKIPRVIAGAEAGLGPACKIGDKDLAARFSHFKILGGEYGTIQANGSFYFAIMRLAESADATASWESATEVLRKIVAIAHRNGAIVVAAHPLDARYPCLIGLDQVDAVEYFNHSTDFKGDTPYNLHFLQAAMIKVFQRVINPDTGGDWHGPEIAKASQLQEAARVAAVGLNYPQLERFTIVQTDSWDPKVVIETFAAGKAYGAVGRARFVEMTTWPGSGSCPAEGGFRVRLTGLNRLLGAKALFSFVSRGDGDIRSLVVDIPTGNEPVVSTELQGIVQRKDKAGGWLIMLFGNQLTAIVSVDPIREQAPVPPPPPSPPALPPPATPTQPTEPIQPTQPQSQQTTVDDVLAQYGIQAEHVWVGHGRYTDPEHSTDVIIATEADGDWHLLLQLNGVPLIHVVENVKTAPALNTGSGQWSPEEIRSPDGSTVKFGPGRQLSLSSWWFRWRGPDLPESISFHLYGKDLRIKNVALRDFTSYTTMARYR